MNLSNEAYRRQSTSLIILCQQSQCEAQKPDFPQGYASNSLYSHAPPRSSRESSSCSFITSDTAKKQSWQRVNSPSRAWLEVDNRKTCPKKWMMSHPAGGRDHCPKTEKSDLSAGSENAWCNLAKSSPFGATLEQQKIKSVPDEEHCWPAAHPAP